MSEEPQRPITFGFGDPKTRNRETREDWERRRLAQLTAKYTPLVSAAPVMMYCADCGRPSLFTPKMGQSETSKTVHQLLRLDGPAGTPTPADRSADAESRTVHIEFPAGTPRMAEICAEAEPLLAAAAVREAYDREELAELTEKYGVPVAEPWPRAAEDCDRCKEMWG